MEDVSGLLLSFKDICSSLLEKRRRNYELSEDDFESAWILLGQLKHITCNTETTLENSLESVMQANLPLEHLVSLTESLQSEKDRLLRESLSEAAPEANPDLFPLDYFYERTDTVPGQYSPDEEYLQRLVFELSERKQLSKTLQQTRGQVGDLVKQVAEKRNRLKDVEKRLLTLEKAANPLVVTVESLVKSPRQPLQDQLPTPLYLVFNQLLVYAETFDDSLRVELRGGPGSAASLKIAVFFTNLTQTNADAFEADLQSYGRLEFLSSGDADALQADRRLPGLPLYFLYAHNLDQIAVLLPGRQKALDSLFEAEPRAEFNYSWAQWLGAIDTVQAQGTSNPTLAAVLQRLAEL